jgi:hypothetical protein
MFYAVCFARSETVYINISISYQLFQSGAKMKKNDFLGVLKALFVKTTMLDIAQVCVAVSTSSRTTGFRYLRELHHITSYTHSGKYYTLPEIAQFDFNGFWFFENVGFSIYGTLIDIVHHAINQSEAGKSNSELEKHCKIKVQAALRTLLNSKKIARVKLEKKYLYVNVDPNISNRQIKKRIEERFVHQKDKMFADFLLENS